MLGKEYKELPPNVHKAYSVDELIVRDWVMEKGNVNNGVNETLITDLEDGRQKWTLRSDLFNLYSTTLTKAEVAEIIKTNSTWKKRLKYRGWHVVQYIEVGLILPPFLIWAGTGMLFDRLRKQD